MKKTLFNWLLLAVCAVVTVSCSKDDKEALQSAAVVTLSATDVSYYSATLNGKLNVAEELMPVVEFGFEYSDCADMSNPTKLVIKSIDADKKFQGNVNDLESETKYYYRAYFKYTSTGVFVYGDIKSFTTTKFEVISSGSENGHDYVDLGLPSGIKWATCNVGASKPEEYGSYFAWGETTSKLTYDWSTYKYGSYYAMTKYCTEDFYGTVDNMTTLVLSDDAARANWGGSWRMPTASDVDELLNNCTWTWTTQNGVYGYCVTSNKSGYTDKSIFLPAAGCRDGNDLLEAFSSGYWSSSLCANLGYSAYALLIDANTHYRSFDNYRCYGRSVRPVCP